MKRNVTIFILNWNRKKELVNAVRSAKEQSYPKCKILVVDNASIDGSVEHLQKQHPDVEIIQLSKNYGCIGGRNRGLKYVKTEYVFFMDDDALLHHKAVELAIKVMREDNRIGIVGGSVKLFNNISETDTYCTVDESLQYKISNNFHGGICMHRVNMYKDTGNYPDHYFYGGEEGYLTMKMLEKGYYVAENKSIILWHSKHTNGRSIVKELINRQVNGLSNRVSLWPWEFVFIYTLKSIVRHPYQAIVRGLFKPWLQNYFSVMFPRIREAISNRKPVNRNTIRKYYGIKNTSILNVEEAQKKQSNYFQCIFTEFIKS